MRRLIRPPVAAPGVRSACFLPVRLSVCSRGSLLSDLASAAPARSRRVLHGYVVRVGGDVLALAAELQATSRHATMRRLQRRHAATTGAYWYRTPGRTRRPGSLSRFLRCVARKRAVPTNSCVRVLACAVRGPFDLVCAARQPVPQAQGARVPARAERLPRAFLMTD